MSSDAVRGWWPAAVGLGVFVAASIAVMVQALGANEIGVQAGLRATKGFLAVQRLPGEVQVDMSGQALFSQVFSVTDDGLNVNVPAQVTPGFCFVRNLGTNAAGMGTATNAILLDVRSGEPAVFRLSVTNFGLIAYSNSTAVEVLILSD